MSLEVVTPGAATPLAVPGVLGGAYWGAGSLLAGLVGGGVVEELIPLCDRSDQRTCQFGASAQNVTVLVGLVLLSSRAPSAW